MVPVGAGRSQGQLESRRRIALVTRAREEPAMEAGSGRAMATSHTRGNDAVPLLRETIGSNLDRTIERVGDREALVSCTQGLRFTYSELGEAVDELARALI